MIYRLPDAPWFPDPLSIPADEREPDGFYAIGGDLSPRRLIEAYSQGIFPWTAFRDLEVKPGEEPQLHNLLRWYCPMQRFVIYPDEVHVSHSMRTLLNKRRYAVSIDKAFDEVIQHCAAPRIEEDGAWLGPQMIEAFKRMHKLGYAHSVEVWAADSLAGGLYGISINGAFFGESMFSIVPSGSKIALIALCRYMSANNGRFIDCQFETPHLRSMGGRYISYEQYMRELYNLPEQRLKPKR